MGLYRSYRRRGNGVLGIFKQQFPPLYVVIPCSEMSLLISPQVVDVMKDEGDLLYHAGRQCFNIPKRPCSPYSVESRNVLQPVSTVPPLRPHRQILIMNSLPIRTHRRLLKRLRQRRMCMTRPPHILRTRPILQCQHPLSNHLPRIRSNNMNP